MYNLIGGLNKLSLDKRDNDKRLFDACMDQDVVLVNELLLQGANSNMSNIFGFTPLHVAVILVNYDLVVVLLKHGANIKKANQYGRTAMDYINNEEFKIKISRLI